MMEPINTPEGERQRDEARDKLLSSVSAEERLKELNAERKDIRKQAMSEREERLKKQAEDRIRRDIKIEKIQKILSEITMMIYDYNKLGKVAKDDVDILEVISREVKNGREYSKACN